MKIHQQSCAGENLLILNERQNKNYWSKVDKSGGDEACWIWTGGKRGSSAGKYYGGFGLNGKMRQAHVVSHMIHKGMVPEGMCVLHSCDNPPCCNPAHLRIGTKKDNNSEREMKGRGGQLSGDMHPARINPGYIPRGDSHYSRTNPEKMARGDRNGQRTHPERTARGERQGSAILTEPQVIEIRSLLNSGAFGHRVIGDMFGVSRPTITAISSGRLWRHLL